MQLGGLPIWLAIPISLCVTLVALILVGLASLRLTGAYVALLTFAIVEMVHILIVTDTACYTSMNGGCQQLFGGATGFSRFEDFGFRKLLGADWLLGNYFIVYAIFVLTLFATVLVVHGKLGLVFRALRDNPGYASSRGINRLKVQMIVFGITATLTGLAGAVYAGHYRFAGPSLFDFYTLMFVLAMVVVGGMGSTWGPLIGAGAMMAVAEVAKEFGDARSLSLGLALILFVLFLPRGLAPGINQLLARTRRQ